MSRAAHAPLFALPVALTAAGPLLAGGVDRGREPIDIIFDAGNVLELTFSFTDPSVSGVTTGDAPLVPVAGLESGNQADDFTVGGLGLKTQVNEQVSLAFIVTEPFGADVAYPSDPFYFAADATADLDSVAAALIARYEFAGGVSVYGGPRYQTLSADAFIPFVTNPVTGTPPYSVVGEQDDAWGYSVGVAYERPEIALRVSLTFNSAIEHNLDAVETAFNPALLADPTAAPVITAPADVEIRTPQSVDLAFRTGVAPGTLVFGGVRWTNYSDFEITPPIYETITGGPLVSFPDDVYTYSLGVGRQLTEQLSASVSVIHEPSTGGLRTNLAPRDGETAVVLAGAYDFGPVEVSAGIRYTWIGDAETQVRDPIAATEFEDNDAVSFGLGLTYQF